MNKTKWNKKGLLEIAYFIATISAIGSVVILIMTAVNFANSLVLGNYSAYTLTIFFFCFLLIILFGITNFTWASDLKQDLGNDEKTPFEINLLCVIFAFIPTILVSIYNHFNEVEEINDRS